MDLGRAEHRSADKNDIREKNQPVTQTNYGCNKPVFLVYRKNIWFDGFCCNLMGIH